MNKVIVVGSINMDITARTDKLPDTGETVAARSVEYLPGGKGLNQAVAAAKSEPRSFSPAVSAAILLPMSWHRSSAGTK